MPISDELRGITGWQIPSFKMEVVSLPNYTTVQKNALVVNPGSIVFDITLNKAYCWNGTTWNALW